MAAGIKPKNVLVLYNADEPGASDVTDYYMQSRNLPDDNRLGLDFGDWDYSTDLNIDWADCRPLLQSIISKAESLQDDIAFFQFIGSMPYKVNDVLYEANRDATFTEAAMNCYQFVEQLPETISEDTQLDWDSETRLSYGQNAAYYFYCYFSDRQRPAFPYTHGKEAVLQDWAWLRWMPNIEALPTITQKKVFGLALIPFDSEADEPTTLAYQVINRSLLGEFSKYPDFGKAIISGASPGTNLTFKPFFFEQKALIDRAGLTYPLDEIEYDVTSETISGYKASGLPWADDFTTQESEAGIATQKPGDGGFTKVENVGLHMMGSPSYYGEGAQVENDSHYTYRPGAIGIYSQSYGSSAVPQAFVDWDDQVNLVDGTATQFTSSGDTFWRIYAENSLGHRSEVFRLGLDGLTTHFVTISNNVITVADGVFSPVFTVDLSEDTYREAVITGVSAMPEGWAFRTQDQWPGAPSRAFAALKNGAAWVIGVQKEPTQIGDVWTFGFLSVLWRLQGTMADWLLRTYDARDFSGPDIQQSRAGWLPLGDCLYRPISRRV